MGHNGTRGIAGARGHLGLALVVVLLAMLAPGVAGAAPTFVRSFGSPGSGDGQFSQPEGIATDRSGNVYVTDRPAANSGRVEVFKSDGTYLRQWGSAGTGDGQFNGVDAIAVDSHGTVFVTDLFNHRVQAFTSDGTFLRAWGSSGTGDGQFGRPAGVAVGPDGNVYVRDTDSSSPRVQVFSPLGAFIRKFTSPADSGGGSYDGGIGIDSAGNVYVPDPGHGQVLKVTPTGQPITAFGSFGTGDGQFTVGPTGMAIGSGDVVYTGDNVGQSFSPESRVQQFTSSGAFTSKFDENSSASSLTDITSVAADCAGNVYVAKFNYPPPNTPQVTQIDAYHDASVPQSCGLTVNDTGDTHDTTPGDGSCADPNGKCTLRAAIEEANAERSSTPVDISFNIPGGGVPAITPAAALPAVTAAVNIDGTTQPGTTVREPIVLGSRTARLGFGGLDLQGQGSSVKGLVLTGFGGVGLKLEGAGGDQVSQSAAVGNDVGIEVDSPNVVLDGLGVAGNGIAGGASAFEAAVKGKTVSPAEVQTELLGLGAGIAVRDGGSSLTLRGSVIGGLNAGDGASPAGTNQAIGVLLAPGSGPVAGVTIGDPASPNDFRGNGFGVVAAAPGPAVSALTVAGNTFGTEPDGGAPLIPVSNGIGVLLSGNVSSPQIGKAGSKNTFIDSGVAIQALGTGITQLHVQFNLVGSDTGLADLISSLQGGHVALGQHNMIGLVLGDVSGATVGGPTGTQNAFIGDGVGVLMSGKQSRLNTIEGNTFGRFSVPPGKLNTRPIGAYGTLIGIVASEGGANQIGVNNLGNQFGDALVGIQVAGETSDVISANTVSDNLYGLVLNDVEQTSVGNASPAASNVFQDNWIGTLQAHRELTSAEEKATALAKAPANASDRSAAFTAPVSTGPLNLADALTTAAVDDKAVTIQDQNTAQASFSARYGGNYVGTSSAGGVHHGNYLGMVFAGDVRHAIVGVGGGGPNVIEHNHDAGIAMVGIKGHAPQGVSILGNAIYDNSTPADPLFPGAKGLGIDLATESGGSTIFGPTANDPGDTDIGPNGLQNYPLLAGVSRDKHGAVTYTLALDSTPDSNFSVEIDSSPRCNPYGFGEGLHPLKVLKLTTSSSGAATASVEPGLQYGTTTAGTKLPRGDHYLSATATASDGSTSEFPPALGSPEIRRPSACCRPTRACQPRGTLPSRSSTPARTTWTRFSSRPPASASPRTSRPLPALITG